MVTISNVGELAPLQVTDVALVGLEAAQYAIVQHLYGRRTSRGCPGGRHLHGGRRVHPARGRCLEVALEFTDNATGSPSPS